MVKSSMVTSDSPAVRPSELVPLVTGVGLQQELYVQPLDVGQRLHALLEDLDQFRVQGSVAVLEGEHELGSAGHEV
ncbi:hypothetical protein PG993_014896 [Apiospora rasikravindrae]|uniref:Uncharacterized protein n=1 Tax=Apiospora rasikravindrae TaxID=990691 RepID=A0ABR1RPC6_9PEZI